MDQEWESSGRPPPPGSPEGRSETNDPKERPETAAPSLDPGRPGPGLGDRHSWEYLLAGLIPWLCALALVAVVLRGRIPVEFLTLVLGCLVLGALLVTPYFFLRGGLIAARRPGAFRRPLVWLHALGLGVSLVFDLCYLILVGLILLSALKERLA